MRQIIFRGKDIEDGETYIGNLLVSNGRTYLLNGVIDCNDDYIDIEDWLEVIPETVGQYTGLKDKNGVDIYEDDIVTCSRYEGNPAIVKYTYDGFCTVDPNCCEFCKIGQGCIEPLHMTIVLSENDIEVIGNIHDNPELLK